MGSREGVSAIDTIMMTLTAAHEWLLEKAKLNKNSNGPGPSRPSLFANNLQGTINYLVHNCLIEILTHYQLGRKLVATIASFQMDRQMCMSLDGETESATGVTCSLPQGPSLSGTVHLLSIGPLLPQPPRL